MGTGRGKAKRGAGQFSCLIDFSLSLKDHAVDVAEILCTAHDERIKLKTVQVNDIINFNACRAPFYCSSGGTKISWLRSCGRSWPEPVTS